MDSGKLYRLAAFTDRPDGGNPAGVWLGAALPPPAVMQQLAQSVGFSETAFVAPLTGHDRVIRYYSPQTAIPFCGHATIAAGVVLGQTHGQGTYQLSTTIGVVPVMVSDRAGQYYAALTSVEPMQKPASETFVAEALAALRWELADLDRAIPPILAYAGSWHLVLAVRQQARLDALDYDFERLKQLMLAADLTTLQLIWREQATVFHARNPFPIGGVVEDPATGSAAAALGGYLRDAKLLSAPQTITIQQGAAMGRPSQIVVDIPVVGGIVVTGQAVWL
jgi:PhzF family phenazine biosynthesis protein